ncbi:SnoaL-like polyketide cyclase [Sphaerospermopsis aphanizomenoides BCCUSP55]|uniref:SnoaL-like polyketide cyclase n=1 Tax=Sphaerospermopsis aphanizomenoides TaxID=459663 RepID=UPI000B31609E|nr:SnoaL-like polyketide cyclase [Sphaerospermopsis aphanizomenoides]MBK1988196.1 SnoaL-like polyketide cyclase [Sphaerospermopsis aphanizomenoides BCCUSP55]
MTAKQPNNLPLWVQDRDTVIAYSTHAEWRYQTPPDYTRSNENLAQESTCNHLEGTLEALVQNLVRTFEMEVSFKSNPQQWLSVVTDKFRVSTNGGKEYTAADLSAQGTYNLFMADSEHYKASEESFESSAKIFHSTFPQGFPWEVLEVYSGPPNVAFKWRHWGHFRGAYKDFAPTGETVEIIGMSVAHVTDDLKILSVEHYFDNNLFLEKLTAGGKLVNSENENKAGACPFSSWFKGFKKS